MFELDFDYCYSTVGPNLEIKKTNTALLVAAIGRIGSDLRSRKGFIENPIRNLESIKFYEKFASGGVSLRTCDQDLGKGGF